MKEQFKFIEDLTELEVSLDNAPTRIFDEGTYC